MVQKNSNTGTMSDVKKNIYLARTYRYLNTNITKNVLYVLLIAIPSLIFLIANIENLTGFIAGMGSSVLNAVWPDNVFKIKQSEFSILGIMEYIEIPTVYPDITFSFWNLVVAFIGLLFLGMGRRKGKPIAIYFMMDMIVHLVNCIYFVFAAEYFPFSATNFSELYMKQQLGIWIAFIILTALVTSFLGNKGYTYRVMTFVGTMAYSLIYGVVRYIVFLYVLMRFSILYMALMFFVLGPLFDFLYLVAFYLIFVNRMVKVYDSREGRGEWRW